MTSNIDLDFTPDSFFGPNKLEQHLISKVKGAALQRKLKALFSEGRHAEIKAFFATDDLSAVGRELESVHPMFMGGNYLPDTDEGEVEIARIRIASTTCDITRVHAKAVEGTIHYRVVDEYEGDTLGEIMETASVKPLSLGELTNFFLSAWPLMDVLEMNFGDDLDSGFAFFTAESDFYPAFDDLCRQRVIAHFTNAPADDDPGNKP